EYKAYNKEFSLLLLDVDHFKPFNDKYGHLDGDQVLKYFASSLRLGLADIDCTIFRFGGDEFIVVFPEKSPKQVKEAARSLQATLKERPFLLSGRLFKMSFSGGIVSCATDGDNVDELLANADKAMYVSKKLGRSRATIYRKIWLAYVSKVLSVVGILLLAAVIIGVATIAVKSYKDVSFKFDVKMFGRRSEKPVKAVTVEKQKIATVRMKSGAVLKGAITKETPTDIELRLVMDKGEGFITIKKSLIKKIEREE
ncbi:MAG: GGDEF domain-containing protein, partial [Candidatus Omnitrophica bacterium]|nr:GGDEF domain-containing protein [Candidatus Omnitrophota bacterium]